MSVRLLPALALVCTACSFGVIPRDLPPPEPEQTQEAGPPPHEPGEAPPDPAPAPAGYQLDGNRLVVPGEIVFRDGNDELVDASEPALDHIRGYLAAKDAVTTLRIEGHADDQTLSERRAVAVARWLVAHGVDCKRLLAVGFGATRPAVYAGTPEGLAPNTRIEVHNAALRGRPIGGADLHAGGRVASADLCH